MISNCKSLCTLNVDSCRKLFREPYDWVNLLSDHESDLHLYASNCTKLLKQNPHHEKLHIIHDTYLADFLPRHARDREALCVLHLEESDVNRILDVGATE